MYSEKYISQNTGKILYRPNRNRSILENHWFENFTKFTRKKLWWSSFLNSYCLQLNWKRTPSQLCSYDFYQIFQSSCSVEHLWTAAFEGKKESRLTENWESIFTYLQVDFKSEQKADNTTFLSIISAVSILKLL